MIIDLTRIIVRTFCIWIAMMSIGSCTEFRMAGEPAAFYFKNPLDVELAMAGAEGNIDRMVALVVDGANVNAKGSDEITMFFWIFGAENKAAFRKLYELGADPLLEAKYGATVAFHAARAESPDYLEILLEGGLDPNTIDPGGTGDTLLMEAAGGGFWPQVELLLNYCADLNWTNGFGRTAATNAVSGLNMDMVVRFLEEGYSYNLREGLGRDLDIIRLNKTAPQYQWEQKAIEMLEARGVVFPVDDGKPAPKAPPRAEPVYAKSCQKR